MRKSLIIGAFAALALTLSSPSKADAQVALSFGTNRGFSPYGYGPGFGGFSPYGYGRSGFSFNLNTAPRYGGYNSFYGNPYRYGGYRSNYGGYNSYRYGYGNRGYNYGGRRWR